MRSDQEPAASAPLRAAPPWGSPQLGVQSQLAAQTPKALVLSLQASLAGPRVAVSHTPAVPGGGVARLAGPRWPFPTPSHARWWRGAVRQAWEKLQDPWITYMTHFEPRPQPPWGGRRVHVESQPHSGPSLGTSLGQGGHRSLRKQRVVFATWRKWAPKGEVNKHSGDVYKSNVLSISFAVQLHLPLNVSMFKHKRGFELVTSQRSRRPQGLLRNPSRS